MEIQGCSATASVRIRHTAKGYLAKVVIVTAETALFRTYYLSHPDEAGKAILRTMQSAQVARCWVQCSLPLGEAYPTIPHNQDCTAYTATTPDDQGQPTPEETEPNRGG